MLKPEVWLLGEDLGHVHMTLMSSSLLLCVSS